MLSKLVKQLLSVDNIAITSHVNPDGDAIASELAMFEALKSMGKKVCIINPSQTPKVYQFLNFSSEIKTEKLCEFEIKTLITLDVPSLERLGAVSVIAENVDLVINIDHHISNTNFGDLNIIDVKASSVGEILYFLFKQMNVKITPSIAESLFVAIATDTGFFRHTNTSPTTFEVCVDLMKNGVELERISNNIHYNRTENGYKLLARVLETLTVKDKFGYAVVSQDMFEQTNTTMEETDDFINYVRSIEGVKVAAIFKEHNDRKIKVSMRSNSDFDVNKFAAIFGGGGHPKAAGFSFEGSLQECIERVVAEMDKAG